MNQIIRTKEQWLDLLDTLNLNGVAYVAASNLDESGAPQQYPVLVKMSPTTVYDENDEPMPAYFVILVTREEATALLEMERPGLEQYQYAEAL